MRVKELSEKSKWYLPIEARHTAYHYAMQYRDWQNEYAALGGTGYRRIDGMPHGDNVTDPTERDGIRRAEISDKMKLIEDTALETDEHLYHWILIAVTQPVAYPYLRKVLNMPCGERQFYEKKREFYWRLNKKI